MIARLLLSLALLVIGFASAAAQPIPKNAVQYLPELVYIQRDIWPAAPMPSFLAAQVEQETCITLTHSKCWNPRAELRTSRENGIGLGQFTRAYNANGSIRFDKIAELSSTYQSLRGWSWAKRYDPHYQLIAIVEMNKGIYGRQRDAASTRDRLAFSLSAYNGGEGAVLQDRRLCANTKGCNPAKWDGNVAKTSLKSKVPKPGYGKSFYAINREYVTNVLDVRRPKYEPYFDR
jgi:hypothetical protein